MQKKAGGNLALVHLDKGVLAFKTCPNSGNMELNSRPTHCFDFCPEEAFGNMLQAAVVLQPRNRASFRPKNFSETMSKPQRCHRYHRSHVIIGRSRVHVVTGQSFCLFDFFMFVRPAEKCLELITAQLES